MFPFQFVVDDAKSVLEKYVAMRTVYPEWFANLDPKEPRVRALLDAGYLIALPQRDTQVGWPEFVSALILAALRSMGNVQQISDNIL